MAEQGIGNTALGAATCRLIEQFQPEETRLFDDPVVKDLVGGPIQTLMRFAVMRNYAVRRMEGVMQGLYGIQVCRTRYIDDAVVSAISRGVRQLVILGAGLDTRAYRLAGTERLKVFEVDLPKVQEGKKRKLQRSYHRLPEHVTFVPVDFATQSLDAVMATTAFEISAPTVFVWEGVTQYISEEAVRRTLAFVGRTAPGSSISFTYILKSVIERSSGIRGATKIVDIAAKNGAPWLFGLNPSTAKSFLEPFHLERRADVGNEDYQTKYLEPMGRRLAVSEVERTVLATIAGP